MYRFYLIYSVYILVNWCVMLIVKSFLINEYFIFVFVIDILEKVDVCVWYLSGNCVFFVYFLFDMVFYILVFFVLIF